MKNKIGIFLTEGGAKGSFHIGFFKALEEIGIKPDIICGSSAGALVGAAATYLDSYEMLECWKTLTLESVLNVDSSKIQDLQGAKRTLMLWKETFISCAKPKILIDTDEIRRLLYASLNSDSIKTSNTDLGITTTELPSFKMLKFFKEDMIEAEILEYVLASLFLPIFRPQKIINNKHYLDIAAIRRFPLEMLKEKNCSEVYIVDISESSETKAIKTAEKVFGTDINTTIINMGNKKPSLLDFSEEQTDINYRNGYECSMKVLTKKFK